MTLAKAFTVRKRITKEHSRLLNELSDLPKTITHRNGELQKEVQNINAMEVYNKVVKVRELLTRMNIEIAIANSKGPKEILTKLDLLKEAIRVVNRYKNAMDSIVPVSKEWDSRQYNSETGQLGAYVEVAVDPIPSAVEVSNKESELKKEIQDLEDKLSELNFSIKLEFDEEFLNTLTELGFY